VRENASGKKGLKEEGEHMNLINNLAQYEPLLAQWFECSIDIWEVIG